MGLVLTVRVFVPFMMGFFLSYVFRSINNVIAPDLVQDVGVDAAGLGLLTGAYMVTFAAFQIPLGILLDRYGPRRTEAVLLLFAGLGAVVFATAETTLMLIVGRGLIGFGVSACLMAAFKAFVDWVPKEKLPFANSVMFATGGLGAMSATVPVETVLQFTDWRGVFFFLAGASVFMSLLILTVVPERKDPATARAATSFNDQMRGLIAIYTNRNFLTVAPFSVATQGTTMAALTLWSGPWLRDVAGWERGDVATGLFWIAAATTLGYLFSGSVATRLSRRGFTTESIAISGMLIFLIVQTVLIFDFGVPPLGVWMAFAVFGISGSIMYASLSQVFPAHLAGRVNTALNMFIFAFAFGVQWGIGAIINLWPTAADGGFAAEGYRAAFLTMLGIQLAGLTWWALAKRFWRPSTKT